MVLLDETFAEEDVFTVPDELLMVAREELLLFSVPLLPPPQADKVSVVINNPDTKTFLLLNI